MPPTEGPYPRTVAAELPSATANPPTPARARASAMASPTSSAVLSRTTTSACGAGEVSGERRPCSRRRASSVACSSRSRALTDAARPSREARKDRAVALRPSKTSGRERPICTCPASLRRTGTPGRSRMGPGCQRCRGREQFSTEVRLIGNGRATEVARPPVPSWFWPRWPSPGCASTWCRSSGTRPSPCGGCS